MKYLLKSIRHLDNIELSFEIFSMKLSLFIKTNSWELRSRSLILARRTANFTGPKTRKKLNSPAWKIYSPADEILMLTYFHGVIQEDRISTFLNCLVGKFQKIACGAFLFQHLEYSTLFLFLLPFWPFTEFFTLFFSACVDPKNLFVP